MHLRNFSPPTPFLKYLIKNHRLIQFSHIIAQNGQKSKGGGLLTKVSQASRFARGGWLMKIPWASRFVRGDRLTKTPLATRFARGG